MGGGGFITVDVIIVAETKQGVEFLLLFHVTSFLQAFPDAFYLRFLCRNATNLFSQLLDGF